MIHISRYCREEIFGQEDFETLERSLMQILQKKFLVSKAMPEKIKNST